ncbi:MULTISPECIES: hypothetical protein [Bacillus cereus group]|uniref:hypothetical protein n=1 Tax=Bacillus cereus group TaxID=86661 RepID=UPI0024BC6C22|nr:MULTISPECIES: hypothetical protein [Bacillus cereus group]MED3396724.1 hypothetical protein [Bacillus wiedmannii]
MGKFKYSESEKKINKVLKHHDDILKSIPSLDAEHANMNENIALSEALLKELGLGDNVNHLKNSPSPIQKQKKVIQMPSWEDVLNDASMSVPEDVDLRSLFTEEELKSNERYLKYLREDFNTIHRLDAIDYSICIAAGILAAAVDIFLVGIPEKTKNGIIAGPLSNYIREKFDEAIPWKTIKKLERQFKVPYDASTNYTLNEYVDGLSSWFHRYHSLGHDPILGFIFGVLDIMRGRFTAIDKNGKLISQVVGDVPEGMSIFKAIGQVFGHMKSDVNTSMGLPVPMMTLFNKFQFGSIGEEGLTIAEVARGMYADGYDFKHFCSMSIPTMIIEVIVRISYCIKGLREGHPLKESIPINGIRRKKPKLQTMLFISHTICTAANSGKVYFTQNPLAINYTEWMTFTKYSISQLKWTLYEKPNLRDDYVDGRLNEEWKNLQSLINNAWDTIKQDYIVIK